MLIGSNLNPYKKLLEAKKKQKDEEYYKNLIQSLYDFFEKECEDEDDYVQKSDYIDSMFSDQLCLEWLSYDKNDLEYSFFEEKYRNLLNQKLDDDIVDKFIKENIQYSFDDRNDKPLDREMSIIYVDEGDKEEDYFIVGRLNPSYQETQKEYEVSHKIIKIIGSRTKKSILSIINEIPDDLFVELVTEFQDLNISDLDQELLDLKNSTNEGEALLLNFVDVGDDYSNYPVGIKKNIFEENFYQYLIDKKLIGVRSEDNSVWEEEEE